MEAEKITPTIRVTWTTTVQETHTAEIPVHDFSQMIEDGTSADDLATWEDYTSSVSTAVIEREITGGFDNYSG